MNALNYRPFTVLGVLSGIHTLLYGIGFLIPTSGFRQIQLYEALDDFPGAFSPTTFGVLGIVAGALTIFTFIKRWNLGISLMSYANSTFWFFCTVVYFMDDKIMLGLAIGAVWTFFSWYIGYLMVNREIFSRSTTHS